VSGKAGLTGKVALILKSAAHVKCENAIKKWELFQEQEPPLDPLGKKEQHRKVLAFSPFLLHYHLLYCTQ